MANRVISSTGLLTGYSAAASIDAANDYLLLQQSGVYKKLNRNVLLGVTGTPADISTVQNFTNKVLDNTNTVTLKDTLFTLQDDGDITKQAKFQLSGITTGTTRTYTLPNASSTLMDLGSAQAVTGVKTMTAPVISGGSIDNTTITVDSIAEHTVGNGVTIASMNIKSGKLNTNNSVVTTNITDGAITPAKLISGTGSGWSWSAWAPTWTNLSVGNGTVVSKYIQIGKTVILRCSVVLGTTSTVSGSVSFTLPQTAVTYTPTGTSFDLALAHYEHAGVSNAVGTVGLVSTTQATLLVIGAAGTYANFAGISGSVPFAWANQDQIFFGFAYEAA